ncbi:hypothetical protein [Paludisphaera sp.]|uniref:hypothetical protein n=1 Tax=Paludisphaera sp. TaxID=2017432 RepID=UPI00301E293E
MLKKLFKTATVLGLLAVAHLAYVQGFQLLAARLREAHAFDEVKFAARDSATKVMVKRMAAESFGADHWTVGDDVYNYLVPSKGLALFTTHLERPTERDGVKFDGKRIEVSPAAVVLQPPGGGRRRMLTSQRADIDLNKPFSLDLKPNAEPVSVDLAVLERDVTFRDDAGTPDDPSDDMVIGPINRVEYDGVNQVIRSDSDIVLVDRGLRVTGTGLEIRLSTKPPEQGAKGGPGIEGAQKITLFKNVRATFIDSGGGGNVLPDVMGGGVSATAGRDEKGEPIPLDVQCQGPLVVELPRKPSTPDVGPPEPPLPTGVEFRGNVVVRRGKLDELPDQIDCDTLHLTLLPGEPRPPAPTADGALAAADGAAEPDSGGGLQLRRAQFSGHAVWIQSPAQGIKIRCVELLHYEDPAAGKKTTILNGGGPKKLWVEKRDVAAVGQPDAGQVRAITHVWCNDATVTDQGGRIALVANGPGLLESRPGSAADAPPRDVPPARTAVWRDQLWLQDEAVAEGVEPGKVLVLKGAPRVEDRVGKSSLGADDYIIAYLNPPAKKAEPQRTADGRDVVPAAYVEPDPAAPPKQEIPNIRRLRAIKNVHLIDAEHDYGFREHLDVDFVTGAIQAPPAKPAPAASKPEPAPAAEPATTPETKAKAAATPTPAPGAAEQPAKPRTTTMADTAEAVVVVGPKIAAADAARPEGESGYELRDVVMRGGVRIHQPAGVGKAVGTDARGELLELHSAAGGKATFDLYHHDPYSRKGRGIDPATAPPAVVRNDQMTVVAETLQVDQALDLVRAYGRQGKLTMLVDRATLTDRVADATAEGDDADAPREPAAQKPPGRRNGKELSAKVPLTVTWADRMVFEGVSQDPLERPAAKIKFFGKARAEMEDALLYGEEHLTLYTDRPVPLVDAGKLAPAPGAAPVAAGADPAAEPEPKADLAMIEIKGTAKQPALVISRKVHPEQKAVINAQRMQALSIVYDRASGLFKAPGPGEVRLYDRSDDAGGQGGFDATLAEGPTVRPVAYRADEDGEAPADKVAASPDAPRRLNGERPRLAPLVLTQILFKGEMRGRFGTGKANDVDDQRWAEFHGAVETMRGPVKTERDTFNPDRLPAEVTSITSNILRVINEPPPPGAGTTSGGRTFLKAWDDVNIRARDSALQADIVSYDSLNDLAFAKGTEGRSVQILQQRGVGQTGSPGTADVVQLNPKTGALEVKNPGVWRLIDERTGTRPTVVDPKRAGDDAGEKKRQKPFRPPTNPAERRGFSGSGR